MTTFRQYDEVAVVEHDDATRQPREGGQVHHATVASVSKVYTMVQYEDRAVENGRAGQYYTESGWRAWDGEFRWRLVPLCERPGCDRPVLVPVAEPADPLNREWCSPECLTSDAEASCEQRHGPGVTT